MQTYLPQICFYPSYLTTNRSIDNHITKLRQKLEKDPSCPTHFRTVLVSGISSSSSLLVFGPEPIATSAVRHAIPPRLYAGPNLQKATDNGVAGTLITMWLLLLHDKQITIY
jgi:hypothetical protein